MYSGEDSSGDALNSKAHFGKWINQSSSNIPKNDVDWAALAQQWIQMKESCTTDTSALVAPPPPKISIDYEEKGEAPMEVVKDDENINIHINNSNSEITYPNQQQWQPSWYTGPPQWRAGWNSWSNTNSIPVRPQELSLNSIQSIEITKDAPPIVSEIKIPICEPTETSATIDATRRKTLPAWIREGLEKMEKEKLKQLEKDKDVLHKESSSKEIQEETLKEILVETTNTLEDENSDDPELIKEEPEPIFNSKSKATIKKSREELLEELMLVVRKSLTELLLEVTNEEIISVAQETLRKNKIKASSAQVFRKSAISSITGKLGLGAYADSASDSSSESEDGQLDEQDSEEEIKENIRIRQNAFKVIAQEIETTVLESEQKESSRRNAEKVIENFETTKKAFDKDFGETQPDKKIDSNGKRNRERTSRFSDAKDSKHRTTSTYIIQTSALPPSSSSELEKRKTKKKKYSSTSSSDSFDSYRNRRHNKYSKKRNQKSSSSSSIRRESGSRLSSDSDDHSRRKKYRKYSKDRSRSRSRSHSYTSRRSEQRH